MTDDREEITNLELRPPRVTKAELKCPKCGHRDHFRVLATMGGPPGDPLINALLNCRTCGVTVQIEETTEAEL